MPAPLGDDDYAGDKPVDARRLVYRVTLHVPPGFGRRPPSLPNPTGELQIDVSDDRLRARFVGSGWPVQAGSEVRLRRDVLGGYVFDAKGGRPLSPGEMAEWFQGGHVRRETPFARVRPPASGESGPGALICRLVAEWSSHPPDSLEHRCGSGGSPPSFRVGPWQAERTADVQVQLPRSSLRADQGKPPPPLPLATSRSFAEPSLLSRLAPVRPPRKHRAVAGAPGEGVLVHNNSKTRIIVTSGGFALGWVDPGATAHFVGMPPGTYRIGAIRPLGMLASRPQSVVVPGVLTIR